jgi:hypothetical protein
MATSQHPFDVWFRQLLLDTFGIDLTPARRTTPRADLRVVRDEPG